MSEKVDKIQLGGKVTAGIMLAFLLSFSTVSLVYASRTKEDYKHEEGEEPERKEKRKLNNAVTAFGATGIATLFIMLVAAAMAAHRKR